MSLKTSEPERERERERDQAFRRWWVIAARSFEHIPRIKYRNCGYYISFLGWSVVSRKRERCFARLHSLSRVIRPLPWERVALSRRLPIFQISGRERAPVEKQPCTSTRRIRVSPPLLLLLLLLLGHPCPPHDLTNVPGLALSRVFFSFSSLPIGSLLDPVLLLLCIFRRIIYIIEIVLRNEISKILDVLL